MAAGLFFRGKRPKRCPATLKLAVGDPTHQKIYPRSVVGIKPVHEFPTKTGCDVNNANSWSDIVWTLIRCASSNRCGSCRLPEFVLAVSQSPDIDTARTISSRTEFAGGSSIPGDKVKCFRSLRPACSAISAKPGLHIPHSLRLSQVPAKEYYLGTGGLHTQNA